MKLKLLGAAAIILASAMPALAATNAVTGYTGGTTFPSFAGDDTVGWTFSSDNAISVTALGWNVSIAGNSAHQVGIWNAGGTLLGSAVVSAGAATDGIWRFTSVSPIALAAGTQYFIGGRDTSGDSDNYATSVSALTLASGLTFIGSAASAGNDGFTFPSSVNTITTGGRFGPNFQFGPGGVPEPASWALMVVGFGLVGGALRRRPATVTA